MSLQPARRGYAYQHLYSAALIAQSVPGGFVDAYIERKRFDGDIFDDLELHAARSVTRVQFKSHTTADRTLSLGDLRKSGAFPLTEAFRSYAADTEPADDYRLIATWGRPEAAISLLCAADDREPLLSGSGSALFRLDGAEIWPAEGPKEPFSSLTEMGTREQFREFCELFTVELQAPSASLTIDRPGRLEAVVLELLTARLGVGVWPNQYRLPDDIAASAVWAVISAGARPDLHLGAAEFAQALSLVVDYGRVPEAFPFDERKHIGRQEQVSQLLGMANENARVVVTGPPGAGKSWLLRDLANCASQDGWATSIHFCYIDPLDVSLRRRTSIEATLGSLIAGLRDSCDYEHPDDVPVYSAGPEDLVSHAEAAAKACSQGRTLLIVDGLDHASRTEPRALGTASQSQVIAEALAGLELPASVCLVVGSQPGAFLDTLSEGATWTVSPWSPPDVEEFLLAADWPETECLGAIAALFHSASAGNPLYLSYLARELDWLAEEAVQSEDVAKVLTGLPLYDADLSGYYGHLLSGVKAATGSIHIAELLALLDFPLTGDELKEILPSSAHHVDSTLSSLRPVLSDSATQGGIRIYHESFQRFMRSDLQSRGADFSPILAPVIDWLSARGFFEDSRAFRSLTRTLTLANRADEAFALCAHDFVARAVGQGFGFGVVTQVLRDVAQAAGIQCRWDVLARVNELMNAANVCFDGKLADDEAIEFARALAQVREPESIAERLTWEGRPEWGYRTGLLLCGYCDEAGAVAPWDAFLSAHSERGDEHTIYGDSSDELLEKAVLRGRIRLSEPDKMLARIAEVLGETEDVRPRVLAVGEVVSATLGIEALDNLIEAVEGPNRARLILSKAVYLKGRETDESRTAAQLALDEGLAGEDIGVALSLGASSGDTISRESLLQATQAVIEDKAQYHSEIAVEWLASVRNARDEDLDVVLPVLVGQGWYRCWLRYCVAVERCRRGSASALDAFRLLEEDMRPFVGTPRTCDLYSLQAVIHGTIAHGLSLTTEEEWLAAIRILVVVSRETTTYLQRSSGGPLTMVPLLHVISTEADTEAKAVQSAEVVRELVAEGEAETTYYEMHAHFELVRAQAEAILGDLDRARLALDRAAIYLTAYGFHKDTTIFGLLDGLETIHEPAEPGWTRGRLEDLQAPIEALLTHTDQKETRHAFPRWNAMIAESDPIGSLRYFALRLRRSFGTMDYVVEAALPKAILACGGASPLPRIAAALCLVSDGTELVPASDCDTDICHAAYGYLGVARVGDAEASTAVADGSSAYERTAAQSPAEDCSLGALCEALRGLRWSVGDDTVVADFASRCATHILSSATPEFVLARIAAAAESLSRAPVLERLADVLLSAEEAKLAAQCMVLAFTRSGDGWRNYGHVDRLHLVEAAIALDHDVATRTLASETIEYIFARPSWNGITEQLPALVGMIYGLDRAREVWLEAFGVIRPRLPQTGSADRIDVRYAPSKVDSVAELDLALTELVFSRSQHVGLDRRARAALAAAVLYASDEQYVYEGLAAVLAKDLSVSAVSMLLSVLDQLGSNGACSDALLSLLRQAEASDLLCLRVPARELLGRLGTEVLAAPPGLLETQSGVSSGMRPRRTWESADAVWPDFSTLMLAISQDMHKTPWVDRWMRAFVDNVTAPQNRRDWGRTWSPLDEAEEVLVSRLAASVRSALAAQGELRPSAETEIAERLLPDWRLRVRYEAGRIVRPNDCPVPADADSPRTESSGNAGRFAIVGGPFDGWYRVAALEHERRKGASYLDPACKASAYLGLWFGDYEIEGLPLGIGDPSTWLTPVAARRWPSGFVGPLVGVTVLRDLAGVFEVLALHPKIISSLQLQPADWLDGMALVDSSGNLMAVTQQWRGPFPGGADLAEELPAFEGVQLILHPEVLGRVRELAGDAGRWTQVLTGISEVDPLR